MPNTSRQLGEKHICQQCNTRFYDLHHLPITCPKCGLSKMSRYSLSVAPPHYFHRPPSTVFLNGHADEMIPYSASMPELESDDGTGMGFFRNHSREHDHQLPEDGDDEACISHMEVSRSARLVAPAEEMDK